MPPAIAKEEEQIFEEISEYIDNASIDDVLPLLIGNIHRIGSLPRREALARKASKRTSVRIGDIRRMIENGTTGASMSLGEIADEGRTALREMDKAYGVARHRGKTVILYRTWDEEGHLKTEFTSRHDAAIYNEHKLIPVSTNGQTVMRGAFDQWMQWRHRKTFEGLEFRPEPGLVADSTEIRKTKGSEKYNLYLGVNKAYARSASTYCRPILDHIDGILCDGHDEASAFMLCWSARMFQVPNEVGYVVPVFKSEQQGAGKNTFTDMLDRIWGVHGRTFSNRKDITGSYSNLGELIFICFNEVEVTGKRDMGIMQSIITDPTLRVEQKYINTAYVPNHTHIIFLSNQQWVAQVPVFDRRYLTMLVNEEKVGDYEYFEKLRHFLYKENGAANFYRYMMEYDIKKFNPMKLPDVSDASANFRLEQQMATDKEMAWWYTILKEKEAIVWIKNESYDLFGQEWEKHSTGVANHLLYTHYKRNVGNSSAHPIGLGHKMSKMCPRRREKRDVDDPSSADGKGRGMIYPSLPECRDAFEKWLGSKVVWEEKSCP